jgi:hypothetical protein
MGMRPISMTKKTVFYGRVEDVEERKVEIDDINTHQQIYLWDSDTWKVGDRVKVTIVEAD